MYESPNVSDGVIVVEPCNLHIKQSTVASQVWLTGPKLLTCRRVAGQFV